MNKKISCRLILAISVILFSCLIKITLHKNYLTNYQNKLHLSYTQLPQTNYSSVNFIFDFEEDDDTEHKLQKDLLYLYIPQYLKVNNSHYTFNYYSSSTLITELYSGIPIYTAICNYRV